MNLRTLRLFCAVASHRSFSKAASASDVTQSAASQAIHQLEDSLGVTLFDRSRRPLELTPAGQAFLGGLQGILDSYDQLVQRVCAVPKQLSGRVIVGSIYSVGLSYMPEASREFAKMHSDVDLRTKFGSNQQVIQMTIAGQVDFGLVSFVRRSRQLAYTPWLQEPMRLVCSHRHPMAARRDVRLSDLQDIQMMGFRPELALRQEIDQSLARSGVTVDVAMEFDNADSMVRAIQANHSVGILPESAVRHETAAGSLCVVACRDLQMTRPLGIIYRRGGQLSREAAEFGSLLLGRPLEADEQAGNRSVAEEGIPETPLGVSVVA